MAVHALYRRYLKPRISEALADTPVVLVNGPRQSGKTTLVQQFVTARRRYLTLDDESTLLSARSDPVGLVRDLDDVVIDEVQRVPPLLLAIKRSVDQDRRPGRFLLTGSANVMTLPAVADSLAGRMETLSLLPLAGCELRATRGHWLDAVFAGEMPHVGAKVASAEIGSALVKRVLCGGYPDAVGRTDARRRAAWARQYTAALISRDVREIANIERLGELPRLLKALAQMSGQLCNFTQLAGQVGLDAKTAAKYLSLFENMFLLRRVKPWWANRLSRIVKTPRIHFLDSGLLTSLTGLSEAAIANDRLRFGHPLESYVYGELLKQAAWAEEDYEIFSYRDKDKVEVDLVIEDPRGKVVGIEVKAAASVQPSDLSGLRKLATLADKKLIAGIVLYDGTDTLPLGPRLWAVPLSSLWAT